MKLWRAFVGEGGEAVWRDVARRYAEPGRAYHTMDHVDRMLAGLDAVRREPEFASVDFTAVEQAIFFHDAVYNPRAKDNEAQSAALFRSAVGDQALDPEKRERVVEMILATASHGNSADVSTQLLLDLDLAVLGSPPDEYAAYANAIRAEYVFIPLDQWRKGRAEVMRRFLDRPVIYQTGYFSRLEAAARENIKRELADLA